MIPSMRTVRHGLGTLCTAMSVAAVSATETPVIRPPAICHLRVMISGAGAIVVRWEAGTPPFIVVRGDAEDFTAAGDLRILV